MEKRFTFEESNRIWWENYRTKQQSIIDEMEEQREKDISYFKEIEEIDPISKRNDFLREIY